MMYIDNEVLEKMIMTIVEGFDRIEKKLDRMGRVKEFLNGDELLDNYDIARLLGLTEKEKSQILSINQANHPGRFYREVWIGLGGTRSAVYATEVSAEEYFTFTTEESEKLEVQRLAEELDGNLELAIRRMAERKREEQRQVSIPKREQ